MFKKIKIAMLTLALSLTSLTPALVPAAVYAANPATNITNSVCEGSTKSSTGTAQTNCDQDQGLGNGNSIQAIGVKVVRLISIIVGIISIIFIIYGGFRYITSGGDSGKVGSAKNTLIYAVIGLIVVALAQIIVNFVLTSTNNFTTVE